jgi:hypothetical protein
VPSFRVQQAPSHRSHSRRPKALFARPAPPMRSLAPTAYPRSGQRHHGRVCLARPPAPTGFLNLLTPSSAPRLLALFHARSTLGVLPSRALLLPRSRTPSPTPIPSCRWFAPENLTTLPAPKTEVHRTGRAYGKAPGTAPTSGSYSTRKSATQHGCLDRYRARGSLGLYALQGLLPR